MPLSPAGLNRLSAALRLRSVAVERRFARYLRGRSPAQRKALAAIVPGGAAGLSPSGWLEQIHYNGRRLAKLNVGPEDAVGALDAYEKAIEAELGGEQREFRRQARLAGELALRQAYYEVREAETQVFYGLYRAEAESRGVDDLLRRSIGILTRALRARAGRLALAEDVPPGLRARLARPLYFERGSRREALLLDLQMRGVHESYWSVPLAGGGLSAVAQFGFGGPYRWLPREMDLLAAAGERCLAAAERARLQLRLREVEERERRRIGRELHDGPGQSLLLLRLNLEMLERSAPEPLAARVGQCRETAEAVVQEIRRILSALSPAALEQLGLAAAVRQLAARYAQASGAAVTVRAPGRKRLPAEIETTLYRVAQECCNNIGRHARATKVMFSLDTADGCVELKVADNGVGFDPESVGRRPDAFGLAGMRERVQLLGGVLAVRSRPGHGTAVTVRLPLPEPSWAKRAF